MARVVLISIDGFAAFYWSDPRLKIQTLRALAERGVVARRMEAVFPTTTWPTHASMVTGVSPRAHGIVGNTILNRATGEREDLTGDPIYDAPDLFRVPTLYDLAHAAGLKTAAIDWPATRGALSLDFNLPFFKDQGVFEAHTPRTTWSELKTLGYPVERQGEWAQQPKRFMKDAMVADLAAHVFHRHAPGLMLLHFLSTDSFQHLWGPRSPEAFWAIEYVDGLIEKLLAALPADELDSRTALFVVSDHGFLPVEQEVWVNVKLKQLGLLQVDREGRVSQTGARFVSTHHRPGPLPGQSRPAPDPSRERRLLPRCGARDPAWPGAPPDLEPRRGSDARPLPRPQAGRCRGPAPHRDFPVDF